MAKTIDISAGFFNSSNGDRKYYACPCGAEKDDETGGQGKGPGTA